MIPELNPVVDRKVFAKAMDLAAVWRREFNMTAEPTIENYTENREFFNYWGDDLVQLMFHRSVSGYMVQLYRDGYPLRSVEVK